MIFHKVCYHTSFSGLVWDIRPSLTSSCYSAMNHCVDIPTCGGGGVLLTMNAAPTAILCTLAVVWWTNRKSR